MKVVPAAADDAVAVEVVVAPHRRRTPSTAVDQT